MKAEVVVTVVQSLSCARHLCDPMDCSPPGSSVGGISQTRILEGVAISSSRGSFRLRDWACVSCRRFFLTAPPGMQRDEEKWPHVNALRPRDRPVPCRLSSSLRGPATGARTPGEAPTGDAAPVWKLSASPAPSGGWKVHNQAENNVW